jgi:hypothetical protein
MGERRLLQLLGNPTRIEQMKLHPRVKENGARQQPNRVLRSLLCRFHFGRMALLVRSFCVSLLKVE